MLLVGRFGWMQVEVAAESVKNTAETDVKQSQFVCDAETGLYYDIVSGQYYDPVSTLSLWLDEIWSEILNH